MAFLVTVLVSGCSLQGTVDPAVFPLEEGTTWVYSYEAYHQAAAPDHILKAAYKLTESIIDVERTSPYFVAHVKKDYELVQADVDWTSEEFTDNQLEIWYLMNGSQMFESHIPVNTDDLQIDYFLLAYDFPVSIGKSWCLTQASSNDTSHKKIVDCEFVGKRMVTNEGSYQTPAGRFDACYELTDYFNNGNIIHWFCEGVGVVFRKFDHAGTRFGFEQTLLSRSIGAPH